MLTTYFFRLINKIKLLIISNFNFMYFFYKLYDFIKLICLMFYDFDKTFKTV